VASDTQPQLLEASQLLRESVVRLVRRLRVVDADAPPRRLATVLRSLERDGALTTSELAARERMRPQSMAETVRELESLGFVEKAGDPDDGRRLLVSLTPAGKRRLAETRKVREDWLARALAEHLDASERETLIAAIELLDRLADA
jgi:DNA-binding MarR family transcriptional regulator